MFKNCRTSTEEPGEKSVTGNTADEMVLDVDSFSIPVLVHPRVSRIEVQYPVRKL